MKPPCAAGQARDGTLGPCGFHGLSTGRSAPRVALTGCLKHGPLAVGREGYSTQNDKFISRTGVEPADSENMVGSAPPVYGLAGARN